MSGEHLFTLRDRVVVLSGGAGQLGRQFLRAIVGQGGRVAVLDLVEPEGHWGSTARDKERARFFQCDVTDRSALERTLEEIAGVWGVPYGLVNTAALDSPPQAPAEENGPFETYPEASWDQVMAVNAKGVFLACQVFGGGMAKAGRGSIVNIGSIYGIVSPDQRLYEYRREAGEVFFKPVAYSASKSALVNLTRYLGTYWARQNVRVNMLSFGGVFNNQDEKFLEGYCARAPMGRMAREDEYNGAVIFLLSDASSYMTGANMVLDGGWTAW